MKNKKKDKKEKGKFLKTPKIKIHPISATKLISPQKGEHHALVSEGRTGYFNDEYEKEMKWLG
jgi:hypothetical protein